MDERIGSGSQEVAPATLRAAQRGDPLAMAELLDALSPYVTRLCAPIALADAADAAQETLIVLLRGIGALREPAALYGWVRTIAVREAVRVARRRPLLADSPAGPLDLPAAGDPTLRVDVRDTLERLSPEHRAVLVLRDLDGMSEAAAARLLDVPTGTVKSRLARARRAFAKEWHR